MPVTITRSMVASAQRSNAAMPDEERWSRLVRASGRLTRRVTRKGITASELRDERPKRSIEFGSETPTCRRHGSKGSTKPLPGKLRFGKGVININIALRNSMIAAGLIPVVVVRNGVRLQTPMAELAAPTDKGENITFDMLKRMLTGVQQ